MRVLRVLTESDVGLESSGGERAATRKAARAVLCNDSGKIALLYVAADNYYKLPGGGVEPGESIDDALRREVMEETGCPIDVLGEVGVIEERRDAWGVTQISYCYHARVVGDCTEPSFTDQELEDGFLLDWVSPEEALLLIRDSLPQSYLGKFVQVRDGIFLEEAMDGCAQFPDGKNGRA